MSEYSAADRAHMGRALELAARGLFTTTPNPRVGCVLVRESKPAGEVIGEGWHLSAGGDHAEVAALADARRRGHDPRGATMYVTLEPCAHHGRTPPCVDAIRAAGLARVVIALPDPNTQAGGGAERLSEAGLRVDIGLEEDAARELNIGFVSRMQRGRPWVRSKIAASLDGRTALVNGTSQWITGGEARADGHAWRARACAVLTGIGTVRQDDPRMSVRDVATTRQPRRVVVDRHGQTPPDARIFGDGGVWIVTNGERNADWPAATEVLAFPDVHGRVDLPAMLGALAARGINELHVEAGARLNGALLEADLIDELLCYVAPMVLGDPARGMFEHRAPLAGLDVAPRFDWHDVRRIGGDLRLMARRHAKETG